MAETVFSTSRICVRGSCANCLSFSFNTSFVTFCMFRTDRLTSASIKLRSHSADISARIERTANVSDSFSHPARCLFASEPLESFNRTTRVVQSNDWSGSVERPGWFTSKCPLRTVINVSSI